jgi:hypothetical protein
MAKTLEDKLRERFQAAVAKTVKPTPLTSPRWLKHFPNGRPADFRYIGVPRLAKATGRRLEKMSEALLRNLRVDDLGLRMEVRSNGWIDLTVVEPAGGGAA